uniref:Zinc finger BED domain-containing protein RICESLEEPER 2-like n=1 Tax=Cucumis melo TaxID=3656 RepID=A0A9I9EA04_CUCME
MPSSSSLEFLEDATFNNQSCAPLKPKPLQNPPLQPLQSFYSVSRCFYFHLLPAEHAGKHSYEHFILRYDQSILYVTGGHFNSQTLEEVATLEHSLPPQKKNGGEKLELYENSMTSFSVDETSNQSCTSPVLGKRKSVKPPPSMYVNPLEDNVEGEGDSESSLMAASFTQENCRKMLARMVILDEFPFKFVESEGFHQFCRALNPKFVIPSRVTVAKDYFQIAIEKCLEGWGIDRLFTVTVDNASSNDVAIAYLVKKFKARNGLVLDGEFIHIRCCAHILNLYVSDALKDLHVSIIRIRNVVKYVRSSPARLQIFKDFAKEDKMSTKNCLTMDVPTRWNSTCTMLDGEIKCQKTFERLEEHDPSYFPNDDIPTTED